jgi:hypothetical protein
MTATGGMRKSTLFFSVVAIQVLLLGGAAVHAVSQRPRGAERLRGEASLVRQLGLTDLCLFTEAQYTRHPSLADLHTPFQDHPMAFEHFPSGSLVNPPVPGERYAALD